MNWYDTLLFLHVLAAFLLVAAVVLFGAFYVATSRNEGSPVLLLAPLADLLSAIGGLAVIVFGIWLAIYLSAYHPWDGWIVAAIVLWAIGAGSSGRIGRAYRHVRSGTGGRPPLGLHVVQVLAVTVLLIDMIYKPGA